MARYAQITVLGFSDNLPYEKVGKNEPICIADEVPFDIPESWEWVRLGTISTYAETKKKINAQDADPNLWGLDLEDIEKGGQLISQKTVGERKAVGDKTIFKCGDILYSKLRPYLLKILVAPNNGICTPEIVPFNLYGKVNAYYIVEFLKSPYVDQVINSVTYGVKMPRVGTETMTSLLVPLPPISEQARIITKLRCVLPKVQSYNTAYEKGEKLTTEFPIQLKKSILQYAVQGKLVPQDPADEPASVLLERIRAEKEQLIKEGKIKRDKHESVIFRRDNSYYEKVDGIERCIDDELPFEIPENWEWVRLSSISKILNGDRGKNYPSKATLSSTGIPFISALNLDGTTIIQDENLLCMTEEQYNRLGNGKLIKNDIVVCIRGSLGKHGRYPFEKGAIASSLAILRPYDLTESIGDYIMLWLDSPAFFEQIRKHDNGTAQPNLAAKNLEQFLIPLPPYGEQHRLIAKAEMFFSKLKTL